MYCLPASTDFVRGIIGAEGRAGIIMLSIRIAIPLLLLLVIMSGVALSKQSKLDAYEALEKRAKASKLTAKPGIPINPYMANNLNIKPGAFSESAKEALATRKKQRSERPKDAPEIGEADVPVMRHRLRYCLPFWRSFCQSTLVLSWIAHGFDFRWRPDTGPPQSHFFKNHNTAFANSDFVDITIASMITSGAMAMVNYVPYLVMPLGVIFKKSNGKPRLIFDARFLNDHLVIPSFKYEDLGYLSNVIRPNDFMVTTDYTSGYHHVDIHPDFWQYLGVEWRGQYYVYTSLPFGLASACWAFTKITRELIYKWRRSGHRCSGYLDDAIHCGSHLYLQNFVHSTLLPDTASCGFLMNMKKSDLQPQTKQDYLGMFVDSVRGCYGVPMAKRNGIISLIQRVLQDKHDCSVHLLEILAGNIASMHWAFGRLSRLMTMSIYADINSASHSRAHIQLSETSVADLNFWLCGFDSYSGFKPLWEPTGFHLTVYTDAAGHNLKNFGGWAGWAATSSGHRIIAKGIWTGDIIFDHSTMQELFAVYNTLLSFNRHSELAGKRILLKTDNQAVFYIINKAGSRDDHVHDLCKTLTWYCIHNDISLVASWIPRDLNTFADFYSKLTDPGDWMLDPTIFRILSQLWGPYEIDIFASYENHQLPRYYSRYFTPTCTGVDAFSQPWGRHGWCNPPFALVGRAILYGRSCKARMCLICPFTPSAPWWPLLCLDGRVFQSFVHAVRILHKRPNLFLPGNMAHAYANRVPRWDCLALLVDFLTPSPHHVWVPY